MFLSDKLIGQSFNKKSAPADDYILVGYVVNNTILVIGSKWDQASNRTTFHTIKLDEIELKGKIV
jgi:hypothetical protein